VIHRRLNNLFSSYKMTQRRDNSSDRFIALMFRWILHHLDSTTKCSLTVSESCMIILQGETAVALLEEKVVGVRKNMVDQCRAAETHGTSGAHQLTFMVCIRTKDHVKSGTRSIVQRYHPLSATSMRADLSRSKG